jgi:chorismate lyase / 3-hydroxybenzoate synthase
MPDPQSKVRPVPDRLHVRQSGPVTDRALLDFQFTGGAAACPADPAGGTIAVAVEALAGDREVWSGSAPAERGRLGSFTVHRSGGWLALHADCRIDRGDVATPVRRLYREALKLLRASEFPHLARIWNYLPDITAGDGEDEVYRQFCAGRAAALDELGIDAEALPAASALGSEPGQPFQLIILASRYPARRLENPRQWSAHRYPPRYGKRPPAFARASVVGRRLLISGTAAIVGHESQYPGDVDRQLRCTADNLHVLLDHACAEHDARWVDELYARVYLRRTGDLDVVAEALAADLPRLAGAVFLRADICRPELLVEVELTGVLR